ncbi:MAG: ORF6N domain-containing protein [Bacteroidota bacterium]
MKNAKAAVVRVEPVIFTIRGERVMIDTDLAMIYGVETRVLNQAVRRNKEKFPPDFFFRLSRKEASILRRSRSQFVILKRGTNNKYLPYAFTEHGAIMAANVLRSRRAIQMSVFVVRAFMKMRQTMTVNRTLLGKLKELDKRLTKRLDSLEQAIVQVLSELRKLIQHPLGAVPKRKPIGF